MKKLLIASSLCLILATGYSTESRADDLLLDDYGPPPGDSYVPEDQDPPAGDDDAEYAAEGQTGIQACRKIPCNANRRFDKRWGDYYFDGSWFGYDYIVFAGWYWTCISDRGEILGHGECVNANGYPRR